MGTCPYCGDPLLSVSLIETTIFAVTGQQWRGVKYYCPSCSKTLSVSIDPVSLKADGVDEVLEGLRQR
jgi:hypothetical protein